MKTDITITVTLRDASEQDFKNLFTSITGDAVATVKSSKPASASANVAPQTEPALNPIVGVQQPVTPQTHPSFGGQQAEPINNGQVPVTPQTHPNAAPQSAPVVNTPGNVIRDANGLPWDARIHSGKASDATHPMNADGKWKKRKGVQADVIAAVENELRAANAASQMMPTFGNDAPLPQAPVQPQPNFNPQPTVQQQPQTQPNFNGHVDESQIPEHMRSTPPQPNIQQPQQQFTPAAGSDFATLMARFNNAAAQGKIDGMYGVGLCSKLAAKHGIQVSSITELMNRPVLISDALEIMTQDGI